ncbi:MAG TPA: NYN domain-containing protein [Gemmatimonadales bacterium]|nr:NYN domain-containing protein [Gemmatimonadales bacterium]
MTSQPQSHLVRPAYKEPPAHAPNAALLIDFDNVTMGVRSDLQSELKRLLSSAIIKGKVAVQRAYADWRRYPQYIVPLSESSIDLIFAPAYGSSKKNATDIRLAIDALELVFTRPEIGTFILLSGDSDFSSLVLKLKEYGKYVIGVGIRESSSDLLIQNCDEYFSYNELAGLTKESDIEHVRHDPWELVVEAVKQMQARNDVMRSDRLKQVMQEIDPAFDEKDVGYSRFSKFVSEAAHRGLIQTARLDNGQFEISLGAEAGGGRSEPHGRGEIVAPVELPPAAPVTAPAPGGRRGSLVGDAFGLMKQALSRLGGTGEPMSAETVREAINQIVPEGSKPVESRNMGRLLRQAHDAELIDLSKNQAGRYEVRVRDVAPAEPAPAVPVHTPEPEPEHDQDEPPQPQSSAPPPPYSTGSAPAGIPARGARFRRGSRGPRPASPGVPKVGVVEVDPTFRPRIETILAKPPVSGPPGAPPQTSRSSLDSPSRPGGTDERPSRNRGGRGRGGRGHERGERDHGQGGGTSGAGGGGDREGGHARRGGRGRGGRGRQPRNGESHGGFSHREREPQRGGEARPEMPSSSRINPGVAPAASPVPPAPAPAPAPRPAPAVEPDGESFWSRVKRGLIGGE